MRPAILLSLFALCMLTAAVQPAPPTAEQVLKEACAVAKKEEKKVFIIFRASWCGWCNKLDTAMNDPVCKKIFDDNFVVRHLTVMEYEDRKKDENPGALEILEKHNGKDSGIPFWLIFDASGNLLAASRGPNPRKANKIGNIGCPAEPYEVEHFIRVLKRAGISDARQLDIVRQRFLKNKS